MKKKFSLNWKSSKKPSKQRKYTANAPRHLKYYELEYSEKVIRVEIRGAMHSGQMGIDNGEFIKDWETQEGRIMGQVDFWINYGKYDESLVIMISRLSYDNHRINKFMGRIGDSICCEVEFRFSGFWQGWKDE